MEKVQDDVYQREIKRQQAEEQQNPSKKPEQPVCGVSEHIIAILFAAFGGVPRRPHYALFLVPSFSQALGLAFVTSSNVVRYFASVVLLVVLNPIL